MRIAVGFNPRNGFAQRSRVAERRLNSTEPHFVVLAPGVCEHFMRRYATRSHADVTPWVETHGYPHSVATRLGMAHTS